MCIYFNFILLIFKKMDLLKSFIKIIEKKRNSEKNKRMNKRNLIKINIYLMIIIIIIMNSKIFILFIKIIYLFFILTYSSDNFSLYQKNTNLHYRF